MSDDFFGLPADTSRLSLIRLALRSRAGNEKPFLSVTERLWHTIRCVLAVLLGRRVPIIHAMDGLTIAEWDFQDYGDHSDWLELVVNTETLEYTVDVGANLNWYSEAFGYDDGGLAGSLPLAAEPQIAPLFGSESVVPEPHDLDEDDEDGDISYPGSDWL